MSIWQDIKCGIFGHEWVVQGDNPADVTRERDCACGAHIKSINWPYGVAGYDLPAPTESTEVQILAELKAIRAALEAQSKPVQYEIKASTNQRPHIPNC